MARRCLPCLPWRAATDKNVLVINYTNVRIPDNVKSVISLGPKFGLPITNKKTIIPAIIKDIEFFISQQPIPVEDKDTLRADVVNTITNYINKPIQKQPINVLIKESRQFFKQNPNIIVSQADKGGMTTVMYADDYKNSMKEMLKADKTYVKLKKDPTSIYQKKVNDLIDDWQKHEIVTESEQKKLKRYNSVTPKLYGLRKTHKNTKAFRPVVNCINTPAYNLAKYLHNTFSPIITTYHYNIKNTIEIKNKLKTIVLPENHKLVSLDVVALFTNIPQTLVCEIIRKNWNFLKAYTQLTRSQVLQAIRLLFNTSYFTFDGELYKQEDGSAMGNPFSPWLASIVMNDLIQTAVEKLPFNIPLLGVYVDDTIMAIPSNADDLVLYTFNSYHKKLQFTIEREVNNKIAFLDLEVIRSDKDGTLTTNWYTKPSSSERILNYKSNHPTHQKIAVIKNLLQRAVTFSEKNFHKENLNKARNILMKNNYPKTLIEIQINKIITQQRLTNVITKTKDKIKYYRCPYIPEIAHILKKKLNTTEQQLAFYNINTTKCLFTQLKDKNEKGCESSLIYYIPCGVCERGYVGQTTQYLKKRINQHKNDCKNKNSDTYKSALVQHHFNTGHVFNFDNTRILEKENNKSKLNISEMIFIYKNNTVNIKSDTNNLNRIYTGLINKSK